MRLIENQVSDYRLLEPLVITSRFDTSGDELLVLYGMITHLLIDASAISNVTGTLQLIIK
jgi:hypothetical protein